MAAHGQKNIKSKLASTHPAELNEGVLGQEAGACAWPLQRQSLSPRHAIGYRLKGGSGSLSRKRKEQEQGQRQQGTAERKKHSSSVTPTTQVSEARKKYIASRHLCL